MKDTGDRRCDIPNFFATSNASSGDFATMPLGVGIPYYRGVGCVVQIICKSTYRVQEVDGLVFMNRKESFLTCRYSLRMKCEDYEKVPTSMYGP